MLTSLRNDKGTEKELFIVTNVDCQFCRMLNESPDLGEIPLTTTKVLSEFSAMEKLANAIIFKSNDPQAQFAHMLAGGNLDPTTVNWDKDVDAEIAENTTMFNMLRDEVGVDSTPVFIIKEGETYTKIEPVYTDPVTVFINSITPHLS